MWTGAKYPRGYGAFAIGRKAHGAHRVSWELHNSPIPDGLFVLHHCDNPLCVNPEHLFLGTQRDNMQDAYKKGRTFHFDPEHHVTNGKLSSVQVKEIRRLWVEDGWQQKDIRLLYGISSSNISRIITGKQWIGL